jgi:PAS domain S-box-containing protein
MIKVRKAREASQPEVAQTADAAPVVKRARGIIVLQAAPLRMVSANAAARRLLRYTAQQLVALSSREVLGLLHPWDRENFTRHIMALIRRREASLHACYCLWRPDGTQLWSETRGRRVLYRGKPAVQITLIDVTERKQAEQMYTPVAGPSIQGLGLFEGKRIIFANQAFAETFGYEVKELLALPARKVQGLVHREDRSLIWRKQAHPAGKPLPKHAEVRIIRKDGTVAWVEAFASPSDHLGRHLTELWLADVAENKQGQKTTHDREETYRRLYNAAEAGLFRTRISDGKLLECNEKLVQMFRYETREQMLAEFMSAEHYVDSSCRQQLLTKIKERGEVIGFPALVRRRDGTQIWVSFSERVYPELDYLEGTVTDITELKRTEEALHKANTELAQRIGQLQVLYDLSTQIGRASSRANLFDLIFEHLEKIVPADVGAALVASNGQGRVFLKQRRLLTPAAIEQVRERLARSFVSMSGKNVELADCSVHVIDSNSTEESDVPISNLDSVLMAPLVSDKDAEVRGLLLLGSATKNAFDEAQRHIAFTMANQSSLAIQHLEDLSAAERERRQSLVENLPEGVMTLDTENRIVVANPAAMRYLEAMTYSAPGGVLTRLGNRPLSELLSEKPEAGAAQEIVVAGPPRHVFEVAFHALRAAPEGVRTVLVIRDVTSERELHKQMELQARLGAIGQLTAGIAHGFNNTLQSILAVAEMLQSQPDMSIAARAQLNAMCQVVDRAATLNRQLLDCGRKSLTQEKRFNLLPGVRDFVRFLGALVGQDIELMFEHDREEYWVHGSAPQLEQVVLNLIVNARDAMPKGGAITVALSKVDVASDTELPAPGLSPGSWVCLRVTDTGTGIPPEVLPHLFEPFFTTKDPGTASGLGLAQAYGIVQQHKGTVDVATEAGKGTTFKVWLPLQEEVPEGGVATAKEP